MRHSPNVITRGPITHPLRRAGLALAALAGLAAGLIACTTDSTLTRPEPARTSARTRDFPINHDAWSQVGYRYDWTAYPYVSGNGAIRFADAYPDLLLVQEAGGVVSFIESSNGAVRWSTELANPLTKFVGNGRDGDRLVISSESEAFILASATGNILARQRLDKVVNTRPIILSRPGGGVAIYGTPTGEVLAHFLAQGTKLWGFGTPAAIEGRPVQIGSAIGAAAQNGDVVFVDAGTGSLMGRARMFDGVATNPVSNGSLMFVASLDQSLYAFAPTGKQVWRHRTGSPLRIQPTAETDAVYCTIPDLGLTAFDAETGQIRWSAEDMGGTVIARRGGRLLAWDGRTLALVDPDNGDVINRADFPGVRAITTDQYEDGNLYAVSKNGPVAKFQPR